MLTIFPWIKLYLTYKNIYVYIYICIYMEFFILKKPDHLVNYKLR